MSSDRNPDGQTILSVTNPDLLPDGFGQPEPEPASADQLRLLDLMTRIAAENGESDLVDWYLDRRAKVKRAA